MLKRERAKTVRYKYNIANIKKNVTIYFLSNIFKEILLLKLLKELFLLLVIIFEFLSTHVMFSKKKTLLY